MSGAELPLVARPSGPTAVYVGASPYTDKLGITLDDVHHDGYKIVVAEKYVALVGRDQCRRAIPRDNTKFGMWANVLQNWQPYTGKPWDYSYIVRDPRNFCSALGFHSQNANGTLYAVSEFLELLGMRWFMPIEDLGQVIPRRRDIGLSPRMVKREPRLASPQLREELAGYLVRFHAAFPEVPYLPIGQPDGWIALDDRDVAAGWDKRGEGHRGRFSDYTWDFVRDVAARVRQQVPQARFVTSSYGCVKHPPKLLAEISSDIAVCLSQNSTAPTFGSDLALRQQWLEKAPRSDFFVYDYYLAHYPRRSLVPVPAIFTAAMARNVKALPERCRGIYTELSWSPTRAQGLVTSLPGINHLMIYLHARFTWDKDLDLKATLTDYYEKFYGPAQDEMQEFFEYAEQVWMRPEPREITAVGGFLKPADVPKYFEILDRARAKAGESIYRRRIELIAQEIAPMRRLFSELKRTGPYVRVFAHNVIPQVDGDLTKPFWTDRVAREEVWLRDCTTGVSPEINATSVAFRWLPDSSLLVGIVCHERRMGRLRADTPAAAKDDHSIYSDDNIEVHLETPAGYRAVVVVNPNGAVRDTCTPPNAADVPDAWSAERVAVRRLLARWTVEIKIQGLGAMPNKSYPWEVNVFRQRQAGGEAEAYALSPTGTGSFINAAPKMGNLYGLAN